MDAGSEARSLGSPADSGALSGSSGTSDSFDALDAIDQHLTELVALPAATRAAAHILPPPHLRYGSAEPTIYPLPALSRSLAAAPNSRQRSYAATMPAAMAPRRPARSIA
jgi:hypothetical protein